MQSCTNHVERLKERLLGALNDQKQVTNEKAAGDAILLIQAATFTKESLQASRLGLLINEVRRKNQDDHPAFAKQCRSLIKEWQKLLQSPSGATHEAVEQTTTSTPRARQALTDNGYDDDDHHQEELATIPPGKELVLLSCDSDGGTPPSLRGGQRAAAAAAEEAPLSPLRIRIKLGRADKATIIRTALAAGGGSDHARRHAESVSIEQAANRRKRKCHSSSSSDSWSATNDVPLGSPSKRAPGADERPNGTASGSDSPPFWSIRRDHVGDEMTLAFRDGQLEEGDRQRRLKSTAVLVEELTKAYSTDLAAATRHQVAIATPDEDEEQDEDELSPAPDAKWATSLRGVDSALAKRLSAMDAELSATKSEMLRRFLDGIKHTAVTSPPPLMDDVEPFGLPVDDVAPASSSTGVWSFGESSCSDDESTERRRGPLEEPRRPPSGDRHPRQEEDEGKLNGQCIPVTCHNERAGREVVGEKEASSSPVDWDRMVPPIDESVELVQSVHHLPLDRPDRRLPPPCTDDGGQSSSFDPEAVLQEAMSVSQDFLNLHSRVMAKLNNGRQVLVLPYVDIGIPDFFEYGYGEEKEEEGSSSSTPLPPHAHKCLLRWDEIG